ncbi:hypothetical protein [Mediterranea massiliensis]|uniref:hypothetical protein n=1 Tax=Mediterranea massiliensis TaxID=1841865 RepID=UPI003207B2A3
MAKIVQTERSTKNGNNVFRLFTSHAGKRTDFPPSSLWRSVSSPAGRRGTGYIRKIIGNAAKHTPDKNILSAFSLYCAMFNP